MVTADGNFLESRDTLHLDNLRRDGLRPPAGKDCGAVGRIALAALAVVALALLGSLTPGNEVDRQRIERIALPGSAPAPELAVFQQ